MKVFELVRRVLFWTVDFFKGGNIRKHYKEIKFIHNNPDSEKVLTLCKQHLEKLLKHTVKTVPFYKALMEERSLKIEHFPIVNKTMIRENYEKFSSSLYLNKDNHVVSTSGSTGNPFKLNQNHGKRERNIADTLFFSKRAGYHLGARLYYLRLWGAQYKKSGFLSKIQNIKMHSVDNLDDKSLANWIAKYENDGSTKNILAYASALRTICQYLNKMNAKPLRGKTHAIIAMSEVLDDHVRQEVKKYFNVEPLSRYSNTENGIIGQQFYGSKDCEMNTASYYVEVLDLNNDVPVKEGEPGRIVITDFFNYCVPLIRYDTGDIGCIKKNDSGRMVFTSVEGRKMDMFTNTKGEYVSSHIIHFIVEFEGIVQFQFVEEENYTYIIRLKVNEDFDNSCESRIINKYKVYFGENANILIEYVNDIPLLPSGKRKLVINNTIKNQNTEKVKLSQNVVNSYKTGF